MSIEKVDMNTTPQNEEDKNNSAELIREIRRLRFMVEWRNKAMAGMEEQMRNYEQALNLALGLLDGMLGRMELDRVELVKNEIAAMTDGVRIFEDGERYLIRRERGHEQG